MKSHGAAKQNPVVGRYGAPSGGQADPTDFYRQDDLGGIVGHGASFARVTTAEGLVVRVETDGKGGLVEIVEQRYVSAVVLGVPMADLDDARRVHGVRRTEQRKHPTKGGRVEVVRQDLLEHGPSTTKAIAERTGMRRRQVSESLQALKRKGLTDFTESSDYHRSRVCVWELKGAA